MRIFYRFLAIGVFAFLFNVAWAHAKTGCGIVVDKGACQKGLACWRRGPKVAPTNAAFAKATRRCCSKYSNKRARGSCEFGVLIGHNRLDKPIKPRGSYSDSEYLVPDAAERDGFSDPQNDFPVGDQWEPLLPDDSTELDFPQQSERRIEPRGSF